jgi:hypothetical protein
MENINFMKVLDTIITWKIAQSSDIEPSDKLDCLNDIIALIDENKPMADVRRYAIKFLNKLMLDNVCEKFNVTSDNAHTKQLYLFMKILELDDTLSTVPAWPAKHRGG